MDSDAKEVVAAGGMLGYAHDERYRAMERPILLVLSVILLLGFLLPVYGNSQTTWQFENLVALFSRRVSVGSTQWTAAAMPLALSAMVFTAALLKRRGAALLVTSLAATALCVVVLRARGKMVLSPLHIDEDWAGGYDPLAGTLMLMRCLALMAVWPALWVNIRGEGREIFRIVALVAATVLLVATAFHAALAAAGVNGGLARYSFDHMDSPLWRMGYIGAGRAALATLFLAGISAITFCWALVPKRAAARAALLLLAVTGLIWLGQAMLLAHARARTWRPELAELVELAKLLCWLGGAAAIVPVMLTHFAAHGGRPVKRAAMKPLFSAGGAAAATPWPPAATMRAGQVAAAPIAAIPVEEDPGR